MRPIPTFLFIWSLFSSLAGLSVRAAYTELYRPQYHFTASSGWIGDPDGLIRYNNTYHMFWWGHAVSSDLVYWTQQSYPMQGGDGTFVYYSGSVVVDTNNTGGFKNGSTMPMVAVYTANNNTTGLQNQRLSVCTNSSYATFKYYSGNPVLDIGSTSFRDPDVFWDAPRHRWLMAISLANQHKIRFYGSTDLKSWTPLSDFGPAGARDSDWEDPCLFQLPVDGNVHNMKWVLVCDKGPNKIQYFVGNFDGTNFTLDAATQAYLSQGTGINGAVFADFEGTTYPSGWTVTGSAFGAGPVQGTLPNQQTLLGYLGSRLVNSYFNGDGTTGTLTSTVFKITNNCINFLIGGGNNPGTTCINLIVNGTVIQTATGNNDEILRWNGWNVAQWKGQNAQIQIVDNATGGWGHILIDHITFSDELWNFNLEHANWVDWGSDFYAARIYRDYDNVEPCIAWLGWMCNWQYANSIPTIPIPPGWGGAGAESIPRNLQLVSSPKGCQLIQQPLSRLQTLRGTLVAVPPFTVQNTVNLGQFQPATNCYELEAVFNLFGTNQNFGLNLCVGGTTNKVVVGYDASTSNIYLDRTASGNVSFSSSFPNVVTAPFSTKDGYIKFHVFVDQSSVEIFVNDGQAVLTSLIYPNPSSLGMQVFSVNGPTVLRNVNAWKLSRIWN
jgi:fructan beta-fructosidase